ncbi:hypothetical protein [Bacillus wiedmannii]|uniref:hypothetical protein n=1 Tax=Bacillus wiedmannii TaxID=1890302 RepID=UPI0011553E98|nr:hypothetical protein [Bacillus wiedmannii]
MSDIPINFKKISYTIVVRLIVEIKGYAENLTLTINGERFSFVTFTNPSFLIDTQRYAVIKDRRNFDLN